MEPFSWIKFFAGFNIFRGATLAKILYYVIIVIICLTAFYKIFLEPKQVTTIGQGGTQIINQAEKDAVGIGCNMWKAYIRAGVK